jgi:hypothetical protein
MIFASLNSSSGPSLVWAAFWAAIGTAIVFIGLWMEHRNSGKDFSNVKEMRRFEWKAKWGWRILMLGIAVEVATAGTLAIREQINEARNNPLKQPVSQVYAILRFEIDATNYDPKKPIDLDKTSLSFGSFSFFAKEARWFEHVDNLATHHVKYYGVAIRFEQSVLPNFEWNDINSTNPYDFIPPIVTVTDAISKTTSLFAYVDFIPKNTDVIKCSTQIFINGHPKNFQLSSNCISKAYSEWNPGRPGIFLVETNLIP